MKTSKLFLAIITIMVVFGCAKIETPNTSTIPRNDKSEYAIVFSNGNPLTKSIANPALTHDYTSFDVYAWKDGTTTAMSPYTVSKNGNEWKYDGIGTQELQYFDRNADKYDFLGVITGGTVAPANVALNVTGVKAFENSNNETDTPDELLWAQASIVKAAYDSEVALTFNHANAKMYIGFVSDRNDTEILDYTPTIPEVPASPGTPDTETYTSKTTKFIDELVAGNEVQVAIGFYGANSPKLTKTNPNPLYIGSDNTSNGYLAKTWLLSIKDAVNAQFVYYKLNAVNNSTSKTETTEDWDSKASNKNLYMMKLADGVDKAAFAAGNDVFSTALKAHQTDWVGGSPAESFWAMFEQAYADGWRVVRINTNVAYKNFPVDMTVESTKDNEVYVYLASNVEKTTQVCTITPGTPATTGSPEIPGINGIRVFSVSTDATTGKNIRAPHTTEASAVLGNNACVLTQTANSGDGADSNITFVKPTSSTVAQVADFTTVNENTTITWSPTVWYALPIANPDNGYVVKFSYTYNGNSYYDARVHIPATDSSFEQGKYYRYVICIGNKSNGSTDPGEAGTDKDEVDTDNLPIRFTVIVNTYIDGEFKTYTLAE